MKYKYLIILLITFLLNGFAEAQKTVASKDAFRSAKDTMSLAKTDTARLDTTHRRSNSLNAPVDYQAKDSIIMTNNNWAYLFGESDVKYQQIELQSERIEVNMDSSLVFAKFGIDSIGTEFGYPLFKEGEQQYESKTMRYNFNTKKGYITDVITQQGEGYVTAGRTKKMDNDILNMLGGRYTTCDEHEHPHFYIQMTKAKVQPKKRIVTGPVYMVFEDVPLYPIGLPFCFFPFSSSYSSGILFPTFGDESSRGFYLRDGGYYFALSDYMDLALTGEIYTKGSWGLTARSSYRKRYKYSGNFNVSYLTTKLGDKGLPDYSLSKDFKINWSHSQDSKADPYRTFSASVNFSTSSYDKNNLNSYFTSGSYAERSQNTKGSSVSITQRFPNNPLSISATMNVNQRSADSTISMTLPDITLTLSSIYPFKRKHAVGDEHWYEKIRMSYTGYLRNSITTKENKLFHSSLTRDWRNAMQHQIPISATFTLLKYFQLTPGVNYTERWYTNKVDQAYNLQKQVVEAADTTYGFYRVFDYNASLGLSTTMYGNFTPVPFLSKITKILKIRHLFKPSVSLSMAPDFGSSRYGFWKTIEYEDKYGQIQKFVYSPFGNEMFGTAPNGKQGSVNFTFDNNLEMKVKSDKDSTGEKKISLIDKLSLGISYNMAADSFKWSDMNVSLHLKLSKSYSINMTGILDTYGYGYNESTKSIYRIDKPRWSVGKGLGRLKSTSTSFSYTLNNDTFKKLFGKEDSKTDGKSKRNENGNPEGGDQDMSNSPENGEQKEKKGGRLLGEKKKTGDYDEDGYLVNSVPWSLSINYSLQLGYNLQKFNIDTREYAYRLTHGLSFSGNIQPTKNWRFNFNATYDFDYHKLSNMTCNITRNLHCWQMTASFVPIGPFKSYTFNVAVSSSLLKDLKWRQTGNYRDGQSWY
ncbi:MAG: putative LPS assembly protein LptD [Parabacteroides sp.]